MEEAVNIIIKKQVKKIFKTIEFDKVNTSGRIINKYILSEKRGRKKMEEMFFYNPDIIPFSNVDGIVNKKGDKITIGWRKP